MTSTPPGARPARPSPHPQPGARPGLPSSPPDPAAAARIIRTLREHPGWSVFWDKRFGVWRAADDDPDSDLYAESSDADTVISYIQANA